MYDISITVTGLSSGTLIVLNTSPITDQLTFTSDGLQKFRLSLVTGQSYNINTDSLTGTDGGITCAVADGIASSGTVTASNIFIAVECFDGNYNYIVQSCLPIYAQG